MGQSDHDIAGLVAQLSCRLEMQVQQTMSHSGLP
jgi:hypothetical protein